LQGTGGVGKLFFPIRSHFCGLGGEYITRVVEQVRLGLIVAVSTRWTGCRRETTPCWKGDVLVPARGHGPMIAY